MCKVPESEKSHAKKGSKNLRTRYKKSKMVKLIRSLIVLKN